MNSPIPTISGYKMTLKILRGNLTLVRRLDGGLFSPQEAADMDDPGGHAIPAGKKELEELRPIRAFVRMGDGTPTAEAPAVMDEATPTDLAPLHEPPAAPQVATHNFRFSEDC